MNKEPEDNSIDKLFRTSIDNMETEPSDRFWNRAYDAILKNESKSYETRMRIWRGVSAVLAIVLVSLIGYNVYTNHKVTDIEKQVASIESKQLQATNDESQAANTAANSLNSTTNANNNSQLSNAADISTNNVVNQNSNSATVAENRNQGTNVSSPLVKVNNTSSQQIVSSPSLVKANTSSQQIASAPLVKANTSSEQIATTENVNRVAAKAEQEQEQSNPVVAPVSNNESQADNDGNSNEKLVNNLIYLDKRTPSEPITIPLQDTDNDVLAMDVQDNTTVQPINGKSGSDAWVAKKKIRILPKILLSVYGGPSIYSPIVKDNNPKDGISAEDIKAREQQQMAYIVGVNAGYDISHKFTLQTGVAYRSYHFYINPTKVYAPSGDVGATYPVVTSSGTVNMPYISGYAPWGYDTVATAKGNAVRSYVSVPLRMKYNFVNHDKFRLYVAGGAAVNFLVNNHVTIHCQNQWGEEDDYTYDINGTNKVNFSYMLGLGAEFQVSKGFRIFAEPSYSGAITPTALHTPITTYSCYFDFAAGIEYHF